MCGYVSMEWMKTYFIGIIQSILSTCNKRTNICLFTFVNIFFFFFACFYFYEMNRIKWTFFISIFFFVCCNRYNENEWNKSIIIFFIKHTKQCFCHILTNFVIGFHVTLIKKIVTSPLFKFKMWGKDQKSEFKRLETSFMSVEKCRLKLVHIIEYRNWYRKNRIW